MSRPETTIFGSLSSKPASGARSLGDFSRTSNPPPSGGGEWDPSQESGKRRLACAFAPLLSEPLVAAARRHVEREWPVDALVLEPVAGVASRQGAQRHRAAHEAELGVRFAGRHQGVDLIDLREWTQRLGRGLETFHSAEGLRKGNGYATIPRPAGL